MKCTLVSFYGPKKQDWQSWLRELRTVVELSPPRVTPFRSYDDEQVHATLIGLEDCAALSGPNPDKTWTSRAWGPIQDVLPLTIQLGGFSPGERCLISHGKLPFERSFQIVGRTALFIGWPVVRSSYPSSLVELRNRLEEVFDVKAKYPDDNDSYCVLGRFETSPSAEEKTDIEDRARQWMQNHRLDLSWSPEDVKCVSYQSPELPLASTRVDAIAEG